MYKIIYEWLFCELVKAQVEFNNQKEQTYQALALYQHSNKFFCSEWCYNAIFGSDEGWRFSPNQLAAVISHLSHLDS